MLTCNVDDVDSWFTYLPNLWRSYSIELLNCWNLYETGFMVLKGQNQWVLTRDANRPS
jgi:hypothetical protein